MEIDSRCRSVIFKPMMKDAKPIDPLLEKKKADQESKQKEMEIYQKHKEILKQIEVNRLRDKTRNTRVVTDFDCGPCARCRVKDRSKCNDGYNCQKQNNKGGQYAETTN